MPEKEMPLVTVVTVAYNSSAFIRDAIESVLAQSYTHIEYIIGDDCSTDNTWQIIQEYKDPRIRAYRNEQNLREYPNRNKAIEMATGKYLIFIDGDDIIFPHGVSYYVSQMESFPLAGMAIQKNYSNKMLYPAYLQPDEILRNHFFGVNDLLSSSFVSNFFRCDILKKFKLKPELPSGDNEIRLRIASQYATLLIQGWVSWPRETPGQAASKISAGENLIDSYNYSMRILEELQFDKRFRDDVKCVMHRKMIRYFLRQILRGKISHLVKLSSYSKPSLLSLSRSLFYTPSSKDFMMDHSPTNPFRRGFLNKI